MILTANIRVVKGELHNIADRSMVMVFGYLAVLDEQQRVHDIAEAAGQPHGGEQEGEDGHELPPLHTGAHRHQDVEQRRPGAYQHVAGVGEAGGGQQVADGDAGECRRVGL